MDRWAPGQRQTRRHPGDPAPDPDARGVLETTWRCGVPGHQSQEPRALPVVLPACLRAGVGCSRGESNHLFRLPGRMPAGSFSQPEACRHRLAPLLKPQQGPAAQGPPAESKALISEWGPRGGVVLTGTSGGRPLAWKTEFKSRKSRGTACTSGADAAVWPSHSLSRAQVPPTTGKSRQAGQALFAAPVKGQTEPGIYQPAIAE